MEWKVYYLNTWKINAYHRDCIQIEAGSVLVHPRHARMEHGSVSSPICIVVFHYR